MTPEEFDAFYAVSFSRVVGQIFAMCGNLAEANDCVQEAFVRAWDRRRALDTEQSPEAWVRTVAYRLAVSRWRRSRRAFQPADRSQQPDLPREPALDRIALARALRQLPLEQRRVIVLHHLCDLPVAEVAARDRCAGRHRQGAAVPGPGDAGHLARRRPFRPPAPRRPPMAEHDDRRHSGSAADWPGPGRKRPGRCPPDQVRQLGDQRRRRRYTAVAGWGPRRGGAGRRGLVAGTGLLRGGGGTACRRWPPPRAPRPAPNPLPRDPTSKPTKVQPARTVTTKNLLTVDDVPLEDRETAGRDGGEEPPPAGPGQRSPAAGRPDVPIWV